MESFPLLIADDKKNVQIISSIPGNELMNYGYTEATNWE